MLIEMPTVNEIPSHVFHWVREGQAMSKKPQGKGSLQGRGETWQERGKWNDKRDHNRGRERDICYFLATNKDLSHASTTNISQWISLFTFSPQYLQICQYAGLATYMYQAKNKQKQKNTSSNMWKSCVLLLSKICHVCICLLLVAHFNPINHFTRIEDLVFLRVTVRKYDKRQTKPLNLKTSIEAPNVNWSSHNT